MKKLPNLLLALTVGFFLIGALELTRPSGWGLGIPLGAVFLGLFVITKILSKESMRFDEEEQQRIAAAEQRAGLSSSPHRK
jgi:hypothetical protein